MWKEEKENSVECSEIHGDKCKCEVDLICNGEHHHDVVVLVFCCCIIYARQCVGDTLSLRDWSKLKLKQASNKDKKKEKEKLIKQRGKNPMPLCKTNHVHDVQLGDGMASRALASTCEMLLQLVGGICVVSI